jgi:hypothetical protein
LRREEMMGGEDVSFFKSIYTVTVGTTTLNEKEEELRRRRC